jgi:hypothetical protein
MTAEPSSLNCYAGGIRIDVGLDDNRDGTLQNAEIDSTSYVCNAGGDISVLLLGGAFSAPTSIDSSGSTTATRLSALGGFSKIDVLNASSASTSVTLAELRPYAAVLVWTDAGGFGAPATVGNALADYIEAGGHVVTAVFAACNNVGGMPGGRFDTTYRLQAYALQTGGSTTLGAVAEPASPLMAGITAWPSTFAYQCNGAALAGATVVASYADGHPLVIRGAPNGYKRADVNVFPGIASGETSEILKNALLYR